MSNLSQDTLLKLAQSKTDPRIPVSVPSITNYDALPFVFFRDASASFKFNKEALSHLSLADQILFEQFGQGPITDVPYGCMHSAFEAYAKSQPQETAVMHQGQSISYGDLDRQANRLASILAKHGVVTGDNVALFLQRSIPMVVGIMSILKAGAAYVPQHLGVAPESHLNYVLKTADIKVILTLSHLQHLLPETENQIVIAIDELMQEPFADDEAHIEPFKPVVAPNKDNTCFIIFTSGTTGNPNGVQVTHGNAGNILLTAPGNLGMRPGVKVGQILSIAFDMSVWEILGSLGNGATLVIRGKNFMETVRQVDVVISTPSILSTFDVEEAQNVKVVAVAGEPCPRPLADKWSQFCTFYNSCGPTETTIINTAQYYKPWNESLTIGKPTPNNTVYVLDKDLNPLPIGEVGEMWAGGDCVSAGYIGNEELTSVRYRPDPFLGNGRMMFNTRDLGRWTADGDLEHFGRTDDQVKVRGFRVELDSVSAALESVPGAKRAVTLKLDNRHLVGFISPANIDPEEAQAAVAADLPYYCVPKFVLSMEELLMTPRGKLDKRALMKMAQEFDQARTEEEKVSSC
ncbi:MAG: amino acid adenylation domain-containing protein [Chloroflexota bacterium]